MRNLERKQETRIKIELGGLIKKVGLSNERKNVLYGLLLEAKELLDGENSDKVRQEWRLKGDLAFTEENIQPSR